MDTFSSRDQNLVALRPSLSLNGEASRPVEQFQNETLRPILKLQHELFVAAFQDFLRENKQQWPAELTQRQRDYISHVLKTHKRLRATLFGMVCGMMTKSEYEVYLLHRSEVHKRLTQMLIQRLESQYF